jgi:hypothetical protein
MSASTIAAVLALLLSTQLRPGETETLLGVLEEVPGSYAGDANSMHLRVAFRKQAGAWQAYPSDCPDQACLERSAAAYPAETQWLISFDGRALGQLNARTPARFEQYSDIGLQDIPAGQTVPVVGKPELAFGGFWGQPLHRPLPATTQEHYSDPEHWKPLRPSADALRALRNQFRARFGKLCRIDPHDETQLRPYAYTDGEIQLVKAYAASNGAMIARLHLEGAATCPHGEAGQDSEAGQGLDDPWFVAGADGALRYLDSGIWLVDAADYDGDGHTELLFAIDRYNQGGYELYYDGFARRAVFQYAFH